MLLSRIRITVPWIILFGGLAVVLSLVTSHKSEDNSVYIIVFIL